MVQRTLTTSSTLLGSYCAPDRVQAEPRDARSAGLLMGAFRGGDSEATLVVFLDPQPIRCHPREEDQGLSEVREQEQGSG